MMEAVGAEVAVVLPGVPSPLGATWTGEGNQLRHLQ